MTEHGITTSDAHYWAHVSPFQHLVYWYRRTAMLAAIREMGDDATREIVSAFGYVVPVTHVVVRSAPCDCSAESWEGSDGMVGAMAERVFQRWVCQPSVMRMMCGDAIGLVSVRFATDRAEQLRHDFVVRVMQDVRFEVKADVSSAKTGRIFVQTHERHHQHGLRLAHRGGVDGRL